MLVSPCLQFLCAATCCCASVCLLHVGNNDQEPERSLPLSSVLDLGIGWRSARRREDEIVARLTKRR
jgi:hypothetical protein